MVTNNVASGHGCIEFKPSFGIVPHRERVTAWYHHSANRSGLCKAHRRAVVHRREAIAWLGCVSHTEFQMHGLCPKIPVEDKAQPLHPLDLSW